jgi:hypothetical protein
MQLSLDRWEVLEKRERAVTEPTRSLLSKDTKFWQDSVDAVISLVAGAPVAQHRYAPQLQIHAN